MKLRVSAERVDRIKTEVIALFFFHNEHPLKGATGIVDWKMNGALSNLIINKISSGVVGESTLIPSGKRVNCQKILLFGLGSQKNCTIGALKKASNKLLKQLLKINCNDFCVALPPLKSIDIKPEDAAVTLVEGLAEKRNEEINVTILAEKEDFKEVRKSVEKVRKEVHIKGMKVESNKVSSTNPQKTIGSA